MDRMVHGGADPAFGGMTSPIAIGAFFQLNYGEAMDHMVYGGADGVRNLWEPGHKSLKDGLLQTQIKAY